MKNFRFTQSLAVGLLSTICYLPTYADDPKPLTTKDLLEMSLEELMQVEVVSEATGSKQTVSKAPAIVKVITAADIKAMGATYLNEVLETVPELHVLRSNWLYAPLYLIRGSYFSYYDSPNVLLLINNVPLNLIQYGNPFWIGMPINAIARIEVIRGSGAVVHADAFAGAINIVTKSRGDIEGTEFGSRIGSFNTKEVWALHGADYGGFEVATTFEYQDTDGLREVITEDLQTLLDKDFGTHASLAPGPINTQHRNYEARLEVARDLWTWRAGLQQRENIGTGVGIISALDPVGRYKSQQFNTDLTYHQPHLAEHWDFTAQASYLHNFWGTQQLYMILPPGSGGGTYPDGRLAKGGYGEEHALVNWSTFYTGWLNHTLRLETGYVYIDLYQVETFRNFDNQTTQWLGPIVDFSDTPAASLPEKIRQNWHLFVQDAWHFHPDWELTAGWRYYHYTDFGNTSNPNLGLVWQANSRLVTKLLYARAFRAPAIAELYANSSMEVGNPDLKPEIIDTIELAWDYQATPQLQLTGDVFYNNITEAINVVTAPNQRQQYRNLDSKTGYGLSLEAQWKLSKSLTLQGHYDFQTASDQNDHHIPNAPRHKFYFRTDWQFLPAWNLDLQANWVGTRYRPTGDTRPPVANYTTVDLTLRYQQEKQPWEVGLSVRNLFDADAREPSDSGIPNDLPLAGRSLWGEVRYRF